MPSQTSLLGAAGEHHVMSQLLLRGYIAALAPQGVPTADIIVTDQKGERACSIQVKSRRDKGRDGGWHMKAKHEETKSERLFYCFVDFGKIPDAAPVVYVMRSVDVAKALSESYQKWLSYPGKRGTPHKANDMRRLRPDYEDTFGSSDHPYLKGWLDCYRDRSEEHTSELQSHS